MDAVPVGSSRPFEDEFAIVKLGNGSPYLSFAFPRAGPRGLPYLSLTGLTEAERAAWEEGLLWFIRRVQFAHSGKQLVLKSPPHTARIRTLLRLFPKARFVHLSRNPFEIYPSTRRLWKILNSRQGLHNPPFDDDWMDEFVFAGCERMYDAYLRDAALVPEGQLIEIRYESLAADPIGVVERVYERLNLGDFDQARPAIENYVASLGQHYPNDYPLTDAERCAVSNRWGFYFDRFGYER
jgi:hypothetical protein